MKSFKGYIRPLCRPALQNFPFIEQDFDALNNYELLSKVVEYLNKVISSQNEVTAEVEQLHNAFTALKTYVDNFFDNLDVQDEINNKLDAMVEAGTLQEIIASYLNSSAVWGFDTVADMVASTNLINGSYARTLGYRTKNDGGNGLYKIRTITNEDVVDGGSIISMNREDLVAELITEEANVTQFGTYGDGMQDDTEAIQRAITFAKSKNFKLTSAPDKTYLISETLSIDTLDVDFNNSTLDTNNAIDLIEINTTDYYGTIENITLDCRKAERGIYIVKGQKKTIRNVIIKNISNVGIYYQGGYEVYIDNCHLQGDGTHQCTGIYMNGSDSKVSNVILIDCHTAIYNHGLNFYDYIHAWILTPALCAGSKMFDLNSNVAYVDQSYSDTYYITFNMDGGRVICTQLKTFFNQNIYKDTEPLPYLFFSTDRDTANNQHRSSITESDISGARSSQQIYFSNIENYGVKVNNNNNVWVSRYQGGIVFEQEANSTAITEITQNVTTVKNGFCHINLVFKIDTAVSKTFNFTNIPQEFRPSKAVNACCTYGSSEFSTAGVGYLYIGDHVQGNINLVTDNQVKFVKINIIYPIKNENY